MKSLLATEIGLLLKRFMENTSSVAYTSIKIIFRSLLQYTFPIKKDILKVEVGMQIKYSKDADVLVFILKKGKLSDSIDLAPGVILHLDKKGKPLEVEILDASKVAELSTINLKGLLVPAA